LTRDFFDRSWFTRQFRSTKMEATAMQTAHLSALEAKHATLEQRIASESQRPVPDTIVIAGLKKQKLRLKEEIDSLH
jgi:hypothetical protein